MEITALAVAIVLFLTTVQCQMGKTWRVAVGGDFGGYDYVSAQGYVTGFYSELIDGVCMAGNMDCRIVWDKYANCVYSSQPGEHLQGGPGIMGGYYDACTGWFQTVTRMQIVEFSEPVVGMDKYGDLFWTQPGSSFDPDNIKGKTIGVITGWWSDLSCLNRHGTQIGGPAGKIKVFNYAAELADAIINGDVDAGFVGYTGMEEVYGKKLVDMKRPTKLVQCAIGGPSMFEMKGAGFVTLWNDAFAKFRTSGKYKKLCEAAQKAHGDKGLIVCLDT